MVIDKSSVNTFELRSILKDKTAAIVETPGSPFLTLFFSFLLFFPSLFSLPPTHFVFLPEYPLSVWHS